MSLTDAILELAREMKKGREQRERESEKSKSHSVPATKQDLEEMEKRIMKTQAELVQVLNAVNEQQKKTVTEIQGVQTEVNTLNDKIIELQKIIEAGGTVSPELEAAVDAVQTQAQVVDDAIPDAPPAVPVA